jgi:quercetin dioxygenase-like cupin family protein
MSPKKVSWKELDIFRGLGGELKVYTGPLGSEKMDLVIGRFEPGEGLKPHYHRAPTDEIYYIYRGSITVHVGDETYEAEEGDAFFVPAGVVHYPVNNSQESCWVVFVLSPPEGKLPVLV